MSHPAGTFAKTTRQSRARIHWDVGQYAFLIWFHVLPLRLFLVVMLLMVSFPNTSVAMALFAALAVHVIDAVPLSVRMRQQGPSAARVEVIDALPDVARRLLKYVDVAGLLAVLVGLGWALWAKPWWPVRDPLCVSLVALAGAGFAASVVLQATRRIRPAIG